MGASIKDPFGSNRHTGGKAGRRMPSQQLLDVRWVYENPNAEPGTEARRKLQEMFRDKFAEFQNLYDRLERSFASGGKAVPAREPPAAVGAQAGEDPGSARVLDLIERLLDEVDEAVEIDCQVGDAWPKLTEEERQTVRSMVAVASKR